MVRRTLFLVIVVLAIGLGAHAETPAPSSYDGIWFLGFNLHKDIFSGDTGAAVRKAVESALSRDKIAAAARQPMPQTGLIPQGLSGALSPVKPVRNIGQAKLLLNQVKLSATDPRLKNMSLLHTDGVQTVAIAKILEADLRQIGITVKRTQIPFRHQERWVEELESGRHHLFLMGFKDPAAFQDDRTADTGEKAPYRPDPVAILRPLFHSQGEANFTYFRNAQFDGLIEQADAYGNSDRPERTSALQEANRLLTDLRPAIVLFYIPTL